MDNGTAISLGTIVLSGVAAFATFTTRVIDLENFKKDQAPKMDRVLQSLARIEGRLGESDRQDSKSHSAHGD